MMNYNMRLYLLIIPAIVLVGCTAGPDDTGLEYAPNMYHSVPYEPLSQITDEESGRWVNSLDFLLSYDSIRSSDPNAPAEYYNSNPNNKYSMTMREPVSGTIKRGQPLVPRIAPDDYESAGRLLTNPLDSTKSIVSEGKALYERFCIHCHGKEGYGDGEVGKVFLGVTAYTSAAVINQPEGHLFHVITHGKGRMGAHGSQLSPEERWKIVRYVQVLQKQ